MTEIVRFKALAFDLVDGDLVDSQLVDCKSPAAGALGCGDALRSHIESRYWRTSNVEIPSAR